MLKRTPLYDRHMELGAKMTSFAGWSLPERYGTGIIEEHMAVRRRAGLFDICHMGMVIASGKKVLDNLNYIFTNDFCDMKNGQVRYTLMCDESGGIIDDMLVYRLHYDKYFIVTNASNNETDVEWMKSRQFGAVDFHDSADESAQIALQGPASAKILAKITNDAPAKYYYFTDITDINEILVTISRTGYTGEDGFELYCIPERIEELWDTVLEAGKDEGLIPCGFGARDTLRLEAAMPLYGHEMDRTITPFEAGLGFAVKLGKDDFVGKAALLANQKPSRRRIGIKMTGRGIARENYAVLKDGREIGRTTSGTFCPYLGYAAAMVLIDANIKAGEEVEVDIRGKPAAGVTVPLPFYKRPPLVSSP